MDGRTGALTVFFGTANRAVGVDGPGEFGTDVGVGYGFDTFGKAVGIRESIDPEFPVCATHDFHGIGDFLFSGSANSHFGDFSFIGIEGFVGVISTGGFEHGFEDFAGVGIGAARGGE